MTALPIMSSAEIMLWSAATGAVGMVVLMGLVDAVLSRTVAAGQLLAYLLGCALVVILLGGLPDALCDPRWPDCRAWLFNAQVLLGPCAPLSAVTASASGSTPTSETAGSGSPWSS